MKAIFASLLLAAPLMAQSSAPDTDGLEFFETKIRPVLATHCYECHSEKSGKSKGGLRVDSRRALVQGGDTGPAVVPGNLADSLLLTAIRYGDEDMEMPPKQKLPAAVIADFEKWITMGAPDPRTDEAPVTVRSEIDIEAGRDFWAFRPPSKAEPPTVIDTGWPQMDIDRFVLAKLEENNLTPAPPADPRTLIRRLYLVLCGLPPSPEAMEKWVAAIGPDLDQSAILELVNTLLASPRFGERWGQHWLDVARYADSTGGDSNNIYPHAWRYRDYVIDAFNADKPFDQFIREQLAGDLLPANSDEAWGQNLVATGFLAVGQKLVGEVDDRRFLAELVDEQIDTTTRAFMGLTVACARCHDHKTDPIPQSDYYALAGIFRNTETHFGLFQEQARQHASLIDATGLGLAPGRDPLGESELAQLIRDRDEAVQNMDELMKQIRGGGEKVTRANLRRSRTKRGRAESALAAYDERGNPLSLVMGAQDRDEKTETRLLVRGELDKPGQVIEPGFLQITSPPNRFQIPPETRGSGRLALAHRIADPGNPLTARVLANRIWHQMFGQGLVRTPDDFGATGDRPSHPELLDHLAVDLVKNGWSVKQAIRQIVLSKTFQQSTAFHPGHFAIDPDNRFLWRANQRRIEAEAIRDSLLTVGGNLDVARPTKPPLASVGEGTVGQNVFEPDIRKIESNHRSVYLPRVRNVLPGSLELFDAPDASNVTGARDTTTVPLQALFAMNSELVRIQAEALAGRISQKPAAEQISYLYLAAFGRPPTARERQIAAAFAQSFRREESGGDNAAIQRNTLAAFCHALLCTAEFGIID